MFYVPNIPYAFVHGLVARNLVFYTAVNPSIKNSGIGSESKYETLHLLPEKYIPKSVFHQESREMKSTLEEIQKKSISFPLIVKPDIGFRGLLVKKIENRVHLSVLPRDFVVSRLFSAFYHAFVRFFAGVRLWLKLFKR